tara:strand:- start:7990 stop:8796 length:807 start_codon:yes stop_codon:yes gene_type:complete
VTLIEIVIASGISLIVSMAIASIYIYAVEQFVIMVEMNEAQENALWLSYHTKSSYMQAIDLDDLAATGASFLVPHTTTTAPAMGAAPDPANISGSTRWRLLSTFQREWGNGIPGDPNEQELLQTQVSMILPSQDRDEFGQGIVFFDMFTPDGLTPNPGFDDLFYDKVVQYDIGNLRSAGTGPNVRTESADFIITTRYHRSSQPLEWMWCSPNDPCAAAPNDAGWFDIRYDFNVTFRNNRALDDDENGNPLSAHGGIYYFRFVPPTLDL